MKFLKRIFSLSSMLISVVILFFPFSSRAEEKALLIGLKPELNIFLQRNKHALLKSYLENNAGIQVNFTIFRSYGELLENFLSHKIDGAFLGSFTGALAHERHGAEVIVLPVNADGTSTYHGHIMVRKDSGIRGIREMKGKTVVFVDQSTTCGYFYPLSYFRGHGISDPGSYFREHFFSGSHDGAVYSVLEGKADVGAVKSTVYEDLKKRDPRIGQELILIDESPDFPNSGLFVQASMDPAVKKKLKHAILGMHENPKGREVLEKYGALKFIEGESHVNYGHVFDVVKKAGIDLKTIDYTKF